MGKRGGGGGGGGGGGKGRNATGKGRKKKEIPPRGNLRKRDELRGGGSGGGVLFAIETRIHPRVESIQKKER